MAQSVKKKFDFNYDNFVATSKQQKSGFTTNNYNTTTV